MNQIEAEFAKLKQENKALKEEQKKNLTQLKTKLVQLVHGAIVVIVLLAGVIFGIVFIWNVIQSYRNELHYVCFNHQCDYVPAKNYDINWEGTCLTRTDLAMPTKQCGGSIEVSKPDIGFIERLKSVYKKM